MTWTTGSLFTGVEALGLGLQHAHEQPLELAWYSEIDPTCRQVLQHRYPDVPNLGDITRIDWTQIPPVDVLHGGFPCQDISSAGRRAGIAGERSALWHHMGDAVRVLRPRYVFVENVAALVVRGLDVVLGDLAESGYDTVWCCLPASAVGAPHRRARIFLVAWPADPSSVGLGPGTGLRPGEPGRIRRGRPGDHDGPPLPEGRASAPDPVGAGIDTDRRVRERDHRSRTRAGRPPVPAGPQVARPTHPEPGDPSHHPATDWGVYGPAIARWERVFGRPAPAPTDDRGRLEPRFVEWMMGIPDGWVTGVPEVGRTGALRALGNSVVPQQAAAAWTLLWPHLPVRDREMSV